MTILANTPKQKAAIAAAAKAKAAKAKPLTVKQQAINQVNAVNQVGIQQANAAAIQAQNVAKAQAAQALGFQHALADITQGDAGRIYDAYGNAADKVSAYGNLALSSTGASSASAAAQAQNYLGTVGPDVGAETRPDIAGALRALGATAVGDVAGGLKAQGAFAQERHRDVRNAQLMRLADIGANATYQGAQTANKLRADELNRQAGARTADVNTAITAIKEEGRAAKAEGRAADDQRMKDLAFTIELQQKKVDLAATKLANATGAIAKKKAQFELDNAQKVLDASLAQSKAETANTQASTAATKAETDATKKNPKGLTPYQQSQAVAKAHDAAAAFYNPPAPKNLTEKQQPRMPYQDALKRLTGKYGLTKVQAVDVLNTYYKEAGADGRPVFDFTERAQLEKLGFTKAQIQRAMTGYIQSKRSGSPTPGYKLYEKMLDRLG